MANDETRQFYEETLLGVKLHQLTYPEWMALVNQVCVRLSGVSTEDLGDYESWAAWDSGQLPYETAKEWLEANDFPFEEE